MYNLRLWFIFFDWLIWKIDHFVLINRTPWLPVELIWISSWVISLSSDFLFSLPCFSVSSWILIAALNGYNFCSSESWWGKFSIWDGYWASSCSLDYYLTWLILPANSMSSPSLLLVFFSFCLMRRSCSNLGSSCFTATLFYRSISSMSVSLSSTIGLPQPHLGHGS